MTNSLSAFSLLEASEDCELCLVGGMYRRRTAAFVGPTAEDTLRALSIDFCRLDSLDAVVCEPGIAAEDRTAIEEHTQVIC